MSERRIDNIAGPPVEGGNFFGREEAIKDLRGLLDCHDILLLGPRRIGKTSIARRVMAAVRAEGWRAVEINVAACPDERGFLDKLNTEFANEFASIVGKAKEAVGNFFAACGDRIKSVKISVTGMGGVDVTLDNGGAEDWTSVAGDLLSSIGRTEERTLIYIDELPILLFNILKNDSLAGEQRVRRFLDWFRNDVRGLPGADKVRWLVSGSVGLDTLVQEHGMADTINTMKQRTLEAFKNEDAVALLIKLAQSYSVPLSENEAHEIVAAIRWPQPYYLQFFFNELRALIGSGAGSGPAELIGQVIDRMIEPGADNDFHHWEERLYKQLCRPDADHARALLNHCARDPEGGFAETLLVKLEERLSNAAPDEAHRTFVRLRDILIRDGYWLLDDSSGARRYRFRLEPLRRWWLRRNTL